MRIQGIGSQGAGLNIASINQSAARRKEELFGTENKQNQIQAIISPAGKKQSMIQQLMKQRQELTERMNALSDEGQNGGVDVKEQMKTYQKQLEALDEQLMELQTEREEEKEQEETSGIYGKPKVTEEEAKAQEQKNLIDLAIGSDQAETIASVKSRVEGRINVLESEIKSGNGNIEVKIEEVSELKTKASDLDGQIAEKLQETNGQITDMQETTEKTEQQETEVEEEQEIVQGEEKE